MPLSPVFDPGPQSGGRAPAPGRLGLVQAFVNSHFSLGADRGADLLASPGDLDAWLADRGLAAAAAAAGVADHARALALREGLRAALGGGSLPQAADGLAVAWRREGGSIVPVPASADVAGGLGLVVAAVHEAQVAGTWSRLKACPGPHCGWAYYDRSRNAASAWCSMRVCGGRQKARAHRARARA